MEAFTLVDGIVAVVIILSAILAYSRGFVREAMAIVGWIAAGVVAYIFAPKAMPLIREIPVLKDIIGDSCELSLITAGAGVLAIALVAFSFFTPLFSSVIQRSALGGLDQALGFLFGVLRGILLVAIALVVYDRMVTADAFPMIDNSRTAKIFARTQDKINESLPSDAPGWLQEKFGALLDTCEQ